jgi:4-alpha-glucanotransferase
VFLLWRDRLSQAACLFDGVRIDHFRAFADYYAITVADASVGPGIRSSDMGLSVKARTRAPVGEWRPGPGKAFTDMIKNEYPNLMVVAEDLGKLSKTAKALMAECGLPGMKVLQFAFGSNSKNPHLPHNIKENSVCYTGTHDNNTLAGWLSTVPEKERRFAMEYLGVSRQKDLRDAILAAVLKSRADLAIIPIQDWLGLGAKARINKPATIGGRNWKWRIPEGTLTQGLASRIRHATKDLYGR